MSSEPRAITTIKPLRDAYLNKRGTTPIKILLNILVELITQDELAIIWRS